jgi:DNA-directed RNA polymerase specialized sigma24 family protein
VRTATGASGANTALRSHLASIRQPQDVWPDLLVPTFSAGPATVLLTVNIAATPDVETRGPEVLRAAARKISGRFCPARPPTTISLGVEIAPRDSRKGNPTMSNQDSVNGLLIGLRNGSGDEARRVWDRYFERLARLAGSRLPSHARRTIDGEDIALSALRTFCDRARRDQFPGLSGGEDLGRLLATIATRKAVSSVRRHGRQKWGGGRLLGESDLPVAGGSSIDALHSPELGPEAGVQFADECERLLDRLGDPTLQAIAVGRLEGRSSEEIAASLGTTKRTLDRKLQLIRGVWEEALEC